MDEDLRDLEVRFAESPDLALALDLARARVRLTPPHGISSWRGNSGFCKEVYLRKEDIAISNAWSDSDSFISYNLFLMGDMQQELLDALGPQAFVELLEAALRKCPDTP